MDRLEKRQSNFQRRQLADCLLAQAQLCEKIANSCPDEISALKYLRLAQDCKDGAALEKARAADSVTQAEWPVVLAF